LKLLYFCWSTYVTLFPYLIGLFSHSLFVTLSLSLTLYPCKLLHKSAQSMKYKILTPNKIKLIITVIVFVCDMQWRQCNQLLYTAEFRKMRDV